MVKVGAENLFPLGSIFSESPYMMLTRGTGVFCRLGLLFLLCFMFHRLLVSAFAHHLFVRKFIRVNSGFLRWRKFRLMWEMISIAKVTLKSNGYLLLYMVWMYSRVMSCRKLASHLFRHMHFNAYCLLNLLVVFPTAYSSPTSPMVLIATRRGFGFVWYHYCTEDLRPIVSSTHISNTSKELEFFTPLDGPSSLIFVANALTHFLAKLTVFTPVKSKVAP